MITICFTYFRSLTLENLQAALYSVRRQDLSRVVEIIVVDNNTDDAVGRIQEVIDRLDFPVPVTLSSDKHGDLTKTHAWSTNRAVRQARTPWVFFTRADYLLDFSVVQRCADVVDARPAAWDGFVTSRGCHLSMSVADCERSSWRVAGPGLFRGAMFDYTCIDAGVWMARRETCDRVGGVDETLTAWGHAQTHFQWKLHQAGVVCERLPEVLFFHPYHAAARNLDVAQQQLQAQGIDLQALWARFDGAKVY